MAFFSDEELAGLDEETRAAVLKARARNPELEQAAVASGGAAAPTPRPLLDRTRTVESGGKARSGPALVSGADQGYSAAGRSQIIPSTALQIWNRDPALQKKYPGFKNVSKTEIMAMLNNNAELDDDFSNSHHDHLVKVTGGDPAKFAQAWNAGEGSLKNPNADAIVDPTTGKTVGEYKATSAATPMPGATPAPPPDAQNPMDFDPATADFGPDAAASLKGMKKPVSLDIDPSSDFGPGAAAELKNLGKPQAATIPKFGDANYADYIRSPPRESSSVSLFGKSPKEIFNAAKAMASEIIRDPSGAEAGRRARSAPPKPGEVPEYVKPDPLKPIDPSAIGGAPKVAAPAGPPAEPELDALGKAFQRRAAGAGLEAQEGQRAAEQMAALKGDETKALQARADELGKINIDPNRFWNSRSTGQRVMAFLADVLGGARAGLEGRKHESFIQGAIDRDIDLQGVNLAHREAAHAAYLGVIHNKMLEVSANAQSPIIRARAIQFGGELAQQEAELRMAALVKAGKGAIDPLKLLEHTVLGAESPDGAPLIVGSAERATKLSAMIAAHNSMKTLINKSRELRKQWTNFANPWAISQGESIGAEMTLAGKSINELGVLSQMDVELLNAMMPKSSLEWGMMNAKLDQLEMTANEKLKNELGAFGGQMPGTLSGPKGARVEPGAGAMR